MVMEATAAVIERGGQCADRRGEGGTQGGRRGAGVRGGGRRSERGGKGVGAGGAGRPTQQAPRPRAARPKRPGIHPPRAPTPPHPAPPTRDGSHHALQQGQEGRPPPRPAATAELGVGVAARQPARLGPAPPATTAAAAAGAAGFEAAAAAAQGGGSSSKQVCTSASPGVPPGSSAGRRRRSWSTDSPLQLAPAAAAAPEVPVGRLEQRQHVLQQHRLQLPAVRRLLLHHGGGGGGGPAPQPTPRLHEQPGRANTHLRNPPPHQPTLAHTCTHTQAPTAPSTLTPPHAAP